MIQHRVYQCPKCFNTLLVSNKMLHDLRCTEENPATYENMLFRQSQQIADDSLNDNHPNSYERFSSRMSIKNDDGTMIDIVKEKNMRGKEELIEIKYDPQGNIISRKKAGNFVSSAPQNSFHELNEYNDYNYENDYEINYDNNNNTYYEMNNEVEVRKAPSVIYETAEAQEIVYEAPAKYDPHVTVNQPIFEETVINANEGISDGTLNNIIRNTINSSNNNYNSQNDINLNGYDYSQNNYTESNEMYSNTYNINNFDNQINNGNNNIYNNSIQMNGNVINSNNDDILRKTAHMGSLNYDSYNF